MFAHLRSHLRLKEMVPCPFRACNFQTNIYSSNNAHRCREHQHSKDYDVAAVVQNVAAVSHELSEDDETASVAVDSTEGLAE